MSFQNTFWSPIRRLLQALWNGPRRLRRLLNRRNINTLLKAIREEPPDLILENFLQLLRRGEGQSVYTDKFIDTDKYLKIFLLECRKEAGILKVVVWVLARKGIKAVELFAGEKKLKIDHHYFIKPELSSLFSDFSDFEQKGFLFETPSDESFATLNLRLTDRDGHQISIAAGSFFQYEAKNRETLPALPTNTSNRFVVVLHDWDSPELAGDINFQERFTTITSYGVRVIICSLGSKGSFHLEAAKENIEVLTRDMLPAYLQQIDFDYLLLLSSDTVLPGHFFTQADQYLKGHATTDILYFDEDLQTPAGIFHSPSLKPEFSPDYLAADNYIGANFCLNRSLGAQLDWFSEADLISGGYDFLLRAMEYTANFHRLPKVRIHRPERKQAYYTQKEADEVRVRIQYFSKKGISVNPGLVSGSSEILRPLNEKPLVSIIIPFKDQVTLLDQCLQSILAKTEYPNFEILLVSNNSEEEITRTYLENLTQEYPQCRWMVWDEPFNYARLNNWAVPKTAGEFILLLNNDIEVITTGWITKMVQYFTDEKVGAVGAKLLYPDGTTQHAGIVIGIGGIAAHAHKHFPDDYSSYNGRANKVQNVMACTAACLLVRRSCFEQVMGFDEKRLPIAFNDVDLCLKIHSAGYRIAYTPFVKLFHYESISRGAEDTSEKRRRARREIRFFRKKWRHLIKAGDPYYHPELSKRSGDFEEKRDLSS